MKILKTLVVAATLASAALLSGASKAHATAPGCSVGAHIPNDLGNISTGGWVTCNSFKSGFCYNIHLQIPGSLGSWVTVASSGQFCEGGIGAETKTRLHSFAYQGCTSYRTAFWTQVGGYYEQAISASRWICH